MLSASLLRIASMQRSNTGRSWLVVCSVWLLQVSLGGSFKLPDESCSRQDLQPSFKNLVGNRPELLLLGDSITEQAVGSSGWHSLLAASYGRKADLINRGFSGYNSRIGWYMIDQISEAARKASSEGGNGKDVLLTVFFGANDASGPDFFLHVPLDEYGENLRKIIRRSQDILPGVTIVLVPPPPIDDDAVLRIEWLRDNGRSLFQSTAYAEECGRVAEEEGVLFFDINTRMQAAPDWKQMLSDGLHFSASGNAFFAEQFLAFLDESPAARSRLPLSTLTLNSVSQAGPQQLERGCVLLLLPDNARRFHPRHLPQHMPHFSRWEAVLRGGQRLHRFCEWPDPSGHYCVHSSPAEAVE